MSDRDRCARPAVGGGVAGEAKHGATAAGAPPVVDHEAVRAATGRTHHEATLAGVPPEDPRYRSDDPAEQRVWTALREVMDPEIPVSLVDLGLICAVRRSGASVAIDLTFTATACPCMEFIRLDITERLLRDEDIEAVAINEVWDPPWTTDRMTAEGRALLGGFGVAA
jgi:metal-sulfur cluster biosynthetic enzyme